MNNQSRGFVYVATGRYFMEEAINSVRSLRQSNPGSKAILYTDKINKETGLQDFDQVIEIDNPGFNFIDKIIPLTQSKFAKTIFLDTDTFVKEKITDLFELLDRYDIIACHAPGRDQMNSNHNIPPSFPEFNTGLIGFNNSEHIRDIFRSWFLLYQEQIKKEVHPPHDQPAFREILFKSNLRIYCLPHEYNFRITQPNILYARSKAMVIHGRSNDIQKLSAQLDENYDQVRLFFHNIKYLPAKWFSFLEVKQNNFISVKVLLKLLYFLGRIELKVRGFERIKKKKGN